MFTFVQKRRWYFLFSGILLLIGIVAMIYSSATIGRPLRMSIDFHGRLATGGAL